MKMRMQFKSQVQETFDNYKRVNIWRCLWVYFLFSNSIALLKLKALESLTQN